MGWIGKCTISALALITLGCTKGTPSFTDLGSDNLPQPMFLGRTSITIPTNNPAQTFAIVGQCDQKIHDLLATANGTSAAFSTIVALVNSPVIVNCATTGTFSFTLKSLLDLGYSPLDGHTYDIELRGVTTGGVSHASVIHIAFSSTGGPDPQHIMITSGGTESGAGPRIATGTTFKAEIRVGGKLNVYTNPSTQDAMTLKNSTNFIMKSAVAAQNN